MKSKEQSHSDR